ncbi:hypothetical protein F4809DRAFT_163018 [Biscogniauxia mediterranea]|nr:hypothetical protein F4809DRAFT_163018 [Biscogniauxia mediterranea]
MSSRHNRYRNGKKRKKKKTQIKQRLWALLWSLIYNVWLLRFRHRFRKDFFCFAWLWRRNIIPVISHSSRFPSPFSLLLFSFLCNDIVGALYPVDVLIMKSVIVLLSYPFPLFPFFFPFRFIPSLSMFQCLEFQGLGQIACPHYLAYSLYIVRLTSICLYGGRAQIM